MYNIVHVFCDYNLADFFLIFVVLDFQIRKFNFQSVRRAQMHYHAKFCQNQ